MTVHELEVPKEEFLAIAVSRKTFEIVNVRFRFAEMDTIRYFEVEEGTSIRTGRRVSVRVLYVLPDQIADDWKFPGSVFSISVVYGSWQE